MDRTTELMQGKLSFPTQFYKILKIENDEYKIALVKEFWEHLWHNFLREKPLDTLIWYEAFNNKMFFNTMLMHLSRAGWITSTIDNNYAWIELNESKLLKWISKEEITNLQFKFKMNKYRFGRTKSVLEDIVQINGKRLQTGLVRKGFMKAGNCKFQYDTLYLTEYAERIATNLKKGLSATNNEISYQEIIDELLGYYAINKGNYNLGNNISDSRGRSIFQCTKKLFNPVSSKDARATIITKAEPLTSEGFKAVYAFIAELLGYRGKNYEDKVQYGESCYITRELPSMANMDNTQNYDDLHVLIWLQRIYNALDNYEHTKTWSIPIEIDALASVIQFIGILTNDHEYMDMTNLINPNEFKDIWTRDYCSRKHVKKALTPPLYGSSKNPRELWDNAKLSYTTQQVNAISKDLAVGLYANAANFKDFIINHVNPQLKENIHIWNDRFYVECNRFKEQETKHVSYSIYTSAQGLIKTITKAVERVPDLKQFKRYHVTLLIHNLDSQVANYICEHTDWIIPNHDSFTIHPNDAGLVRKLYTEQMMEIYKNRKQILHNYFQSIGIIEDYPEKNDTEITEFSGYALK